MYIYPGNGGQRGVYIQEMVARVVFVSWRWWPGRCLYPGYGDHSGVHILGMVIKCVSTASVQLGYQLSFKFEENILQVKNLLNVNKFFKEHYFKILHSLRKEKLTSANCPSITIGVH